MSLANACIQQSSSLPIPDINSLTCLPEAQDGAALTDHIYMDAMGFGMGCSCLQITFQACSVGEARRVYDALVPVSSVMVSASILFAILDLF